MSTQLLRPATEISSSMSMLDSRSLNINISDLNGYKSYLDLFSGMSGEESQTPNYTGHLLNLSISTHKSNTDGLSTQFEVIFERQFESLIW